jgi:hypothetical protein
MRRHGHAERGATATALAAVIPDDEAGVRLLDGQGGGKAARSQNGRWQRLLDDDAQLEDRENPSM